jgi:hypothetical protein
MEARFIRQRIAADPQAAFAVGPVTTDAPLVLIRGVTEADHYGFWTYTQVRRGQDHWEPASDDAYPLRSHKLLDPDDARERHAAVSTEIQQDLARARAAHQVYRTLVKHEVIAVKTANGILIKDAGVDRLGELLARLHND